MDRPHVTYEYALTNDELATMCKAGLYDSGFSCPDIFFSNTFQLPLTCDCAALPPELESDVPLLFVNVNNKNNLQTSSVESGYDIASYFPQVKEPAITRELMPDLEPEPEDDFEQQAEQEPIVDFTEPEPVAEPEVQESDAPEFEDGDEVSEEDRLMNEALANIEARKTARMAETTPVSAPVVQSDDRRFESQGNQAEPEFDDDIDDLEMDEDGPNF